MRETFDEISVVAFVFDSEYSLGKKEIEKVYKEF